MFTGIVEETGIIRSIRPGARSAKLIVSARKVTEDIKTGDSINTNGVCLTVIAMDRESFTADIMPETMRRSTFRDLKPGNRVNLERALRLSDRLGGHMVSGHIDGTGKIEKQWEEDNAVWFIVTAGKEILRYIVEKGSVALDGISLTVTGVDEHSFRVSIIPHTAEITSLTDKKVGEMLNIECDLFAKYIEKLLQNDKPVGNIDPNLLEKFGF
ncbi:MAG: riboflavin synthase [Bacteroidales bacterium]|jgi:riboflavin synthase|nr:riboflavin synthase [Bacteroidales bacterium]